MSSESDASGRFARPAWKVIGGGILQRLLSIAPDVSWSLLCLLVLVAPLSIEGIPALPALTIELVAATAVGLWWATRLAAPVVAPLKLEPILWPLAGVALIGALQLVPLPVGWAAWLSPIRAAVVEHTFPLLGTQWQPSLTPLSPSPADTVHALFRFTLMVGLFVMTRDQLRSRERRRLVVHLLLVAGLIQVAIGAIHSMYHAASIYFIPGGEPGNGQFFGTFLNRNRNAAYLNMLWPLSISLALEGLFPHAQERRRMGGEGFSRWTLGRRAGAGLLPWPVYCLVTVPLMGGVLACRSRMGWAILAWAAITLALVFWARAGYVRSAVATWGAAMLVGPGLVVAFWEPLMKQVSSWAAKDFGAMQARPLIWQGALQMILEHAWTGVGLGTFAQSFGAYNPIERPRLVRHAESVYLETLAELGLPGLILVGVVVVVGLSSTVKGRFWEARQGRRAVPGLVVGLVGIGLHASVDLSFRGYGTLVTAVVMAGMLLAALPDRTTSSFDTAFRYGAPPARVWGALAGMLGAWGLAAIIGVSGLAVARAEHAESREGLEAMSGSLARAARLAPWAWGPPLWLGTIEVRRAQGGWAEFKRSQGDVEKSEKVLDEALAHTIEAERFLSLAAVRSPLVAHSQRLLSRVSELSESPALALSRALDACRVQPTDYRNWVQLGRVQATAGQRRAALASLGRALAMAPEGAVAPLTGSLLGAAGGDPVLAGAYVPSTDDWHVPYAFGVAVDASGRYASAVPWFKALLLRDSLYHVPALDIGWRALNHGDLELAGAASSFVQRVYPQLVGGYMIEAEVAVRQGRADDAVRLLERVASMRPPGLTDLLRAVDVLVQAGRDEEGVQRLQALKERFPQESRILMASARLRWRRHELSAAIAELNNAIRAGGDLEEPLRMKWEILSAMGLEFDASEALAKCVALARAPSCRIIAARGALDRGEAMKALGWLEQAVAQDDKQVQGWVLLARARLATGDREGARAALTRALTLAPADVEALKLEAAL